MFDIEGIPECLNVWGLGNGQDALSELTLYRMFVY